MRLALLTLMLAPVAAAAQTPVGDAAAADATVAFVLKLYDPATGGFRVKADGKPSLRACNGAVKALKTLKKPLPDEAKTKAFVMACLDDKTGTFSEPGQKSDVTINAVGVMIALELGGDRNKIKPAVESLGKTAKTFEEVRMAAAAVEAWGPKACPFDLEPWDKVVVAHVMSYEPRSPAVPDRARITGSVTAYYLRLGRPVPEPDYVLRVLSRGQMPDGGYGDGKADASDLETTYRVMRALHLLGAKPADPEKLKAFIGKCRTPDGGYGVKPGDPATMSGVYYAVLVGNWLK